MKETKKFRFAGILIILAAAAVFGAAVMLLWNALLPQIFALQQISYLQAVGLLVLARLLFGGIGGWGHGGRKERMFQHGNKLREKWMNMSEEERKEFIEKEKDFFKRRASHFQDFFGDRERPE
jgi:hypothetical protein